MGRPPQICDSVSCIVLACIFLPLFALNVVTLLLPHDKSTGRLWTNHFQEQPAVEKIIRGFVSLTNSNITAHITVHCPRDTRTEVDVSYILLFQSICMNRFRNNHQYLLIIDWSLLSSVSVQFEIANNIFVFKPTEIIGIQHNNHFYSGLPSISHITSTLEAYFRPSNV